MNNQGTLSPKGFSLVEMLVTVALCSLVMGGVMELFRQGVNIHSASTQRFEMQQNARVALNLMAQDFSIASTGFVDGGIQLPTGTGSTNPKRGCSSSSCGTWDYSDRRPHVRYHSRRWLGADDRWFCHRRGHSGLSRS